MNYQYEYHAMINNQEINNKRHLEIISPVTLKAIGTVSALTEKELDEAFKAARTSQKKWAKLTIDQRINILKVWMELIAKNKEHFAQLMMGEIAKNHNDAMSEVDRTVEYMEQTFLSAKELKPLKISPSVTKQGTFSRVAKGVGLAISPFNYPLNLAMAKIVPALVMGNTLVFKPATAGSLTGAFLGKLAIEAKMPAGIFNVVTGKGSEIGDLITHHPDIDFISFTGSVKVGHRILKHASTKDVVLELGGKDPAIIVDDHNLDFVVNEIVSGAFSYSGQRCTAIKRIITTNKIADKLVPLLKAAIENLTVGFPDTNAKITPLIDLKSADYVQELIDEAVELGGTIITGNQREKNLLWPTLVDHVSLKAKLAWEEPFGPVLPIIRADKLADQIQIANDSNFGLQASVFSKDISLALEIADQLEVGTVNINGKTQRGPDIFPFIGIKDSGFGVQGIGETLNSVTRIKGIVINKQK